MSPRGEWGFEGTIMTDWGAMNDRVEVIKAGLDLEMPGPCDGNDALIVQAVREGTLTEAQVDACATRITELAMRAAQNKVTAYDQTAHHELARQIARESAVLLRKGTALPLKKGTKIAVIGEFAKHPRYQGAGSSKINPPRITSLCDAMDERKIEYSYAQGFAAEGKSDDALVSEAVKSAKEADVVIVMLGLPDSFESEDFDREHMNLPDKTVAVRFWTCCWGMQILAASWRKPGLWRWRIPRAMVSLAIRAMCGIPGEYLCGLPLLHDFV